MWARQSFARLQGALVRAAGAGGGSGQAAARCLRRTLAMDAANNAHIKTSTETVARQIEMTFPAVRSTVDWLATQPKDKWREDFDRDGFIVVHDVLEPETVRVYQTLYDQFLTGDIDASSHRHDLGSAEDQKLANEENVCQVMWPFDYVSNMALGPLHSRTLAIAQVLLGDDTTFDFDMLIYKAPHSGTEVPWHQDQGYWLDMPDKRAVSCWTALDNATVDNGCMWFVPGSHQNPLLKHRPLKPGHHVLTCDIGDAKRVAAPLKAGSCTFHHGRTAHHTGGNHTDTRRRAYILNYRPQSMVEWSRSQGFDHGRKGLEQMDYSKAGDAYKDVSSTKMHKKKQ